MENNPAAATWGHVQAGVPQGLRDALAQDKMDPENPHLALQMLRLEMLAGSPQGMESWFQKAMTSHPDNFRICWMKATSMERDAALEFGRELLAPAELARAAPLRAGRPALPLRRVRPGQARVLEAPRRLEGCSQRLRKLSRSLSRGREDSLLLRAGRGTLRAVGGGAPAVPATG